MPIIDRIISMTISWTNHFMFSFLQQPAVGFIISSLPLKQDFFSLVQLQYKAENSGSWAFRLKSVSIRRLDFAKDIKGTHTQKKAGPSRTVGWCRKWDWTTYATYKVQTLHSHSQSSCATIVVGQFSPLHSTVSEVLHFGVWASLRSASESSRSARAIPRGPRSCLNSQLRRCLNSQARRCLNSQGRSWPARTSSQPHMSHRLLPWLSQRCLCSHYCCRWWKFLHWR